MNEPIWMEIFFAIEAQRRDGVEPKQVVLRIEDWNQLVDEMNDEKWFGVRRPVEPGTPSGMINGVAVVPFGGVS